MANLISSFTDLLGAFSEHKYLDDGVDRANRIYAPVLLMVSASLLGIIQFFGDPIECTRVSMDANSDDDYVKAFCWASGTYTILDKEGKTIENDSEKLHISYYQWVPVVLALQAFFFQLPYVFWVSFSTGTGLNLPTLMKGAFILTEVQEDSSKREGYSQEVAYLMDAYFKRNITRTKKRWKKNTLHNLTAFYFLSKVFYVINLCMQLWLLNEFLGGKLYEHTAHTLNVLLHHRKWPNSTMFPLLAECRFYNNLDFISKKQTKKHLCTLPLNLYNDKVFTVVLVMLIFLLICMVISIGVWAYRFLSRENRESLFIHILKKENQTSVDRFMHAYLRTDGMLVLKLVRLNMGVNTTTEIVENLFKHFKSLDSSLKYSESIDTMASMGTLTTGREHSVGNASLGPPSRPVSPTSIKFRHASPPSSPSIIVNGGKGTFERKFVYQSHSFNSHDVRNDTTV